jgi:hypothetical protein
VGVLTWLPRDFREPLTILDAARHGEPAPPPPVDTLIRPVGMVETAALDPEREIAAGKGSCPAMLDRSACGRGARGRSGGGSRRGHLPWRLAPKDAAQRDPDIGSD